MKISKIQIKNFKSFQDVTVYLDPDFNVFTGVNNSGKTNLLEAIALWHECFNKLIRQAGKAYKELYKKGDYILGHTTEKYFPYETIKTVRTSNIDDIFYQRDTTAPIELSINLNKVDINLEIGFSIKTSGLNYVIELLNYNQYNFRGFNEFFENFSNPISASFASPVATIRTEERFVTRPQIIESIQKRESVEVVRNRLYNLYYDTTRNENLYNKFIRDLSYILFNGDKKIEFFPKSDIQKDIKSVIYYKIESRDIEKDISLLGSGTLQIIVILLNLYAPEKTRDLNLILFDEPDSHIHRDIQKRLIDTVLRFSTNTQIFLTTHNETLIRQVPLHQLFHIENRPQYNYNALSRQELFVEPHFKGIYPSALNPIISSLGNSNGLDFINAVEADKIIFVEGQDDAKAIYTLLQKNTIGINTKKYSFWVMGGVSEIFKDLPSYKKIFQLIRNQETLWSKAFLVFDRDFIEDDHRDKLIEALGSHVKIPTYITPSYTFESILLMDLIKLSHLLKKWLEAKKDDINVDRSALVQSLENHYLTIMQQKLESLDDKYIDETCHRYANVREQLSKRDFLNNQNPIKENDISLNTLFRRYLITINDNREFYKMANKNDVQAIINQVTKPYNIEFKIEQDFISLLNLVDRSTWFEEWDFLTRL
ncbi:MAG: AAA family ATPase [Microcystis sp. M038S2]|uniref:ATP-dependent nuclease n=1 Tax=unclassified Microcystis TaxID=2643300 RepID=UPI0011913742|nr:MULTISPECIES: ATP-binding protein [unclassified Microcystis]NCQ68997.1 AAA family ATPase [Microcystis aeruginosa W13-16]NCQ73545.1 AAA family ATPase [Microcystis aeruginosa W13-13]NCQ78012.1 AAA family ATPase [Microcystis aeruginosa W13-15]NCR21804.1 AAA family ATPase [Microcystis aeruginosa L111-01]NCS10815.1 AAA family ATPase [Microcystis aeruginosa G13-09]NCS43364.1 AAA family ATPase [Microcystis aeruginosa BS11-05]NCS53170.1 AAA family ATPase [Microcystis aeruginosa G13-05]TRU55935.1